MKCPLFRCIQSPQYYAHRAKLEVIDREKDIEKMNRDALRIAREVADNTGTLMAGNICNTTVYNPNDPEWKEKAVAIFKVCTLYFSSSLIRAKNKWRTC